MKSEGFILILMLMYPIQGVNILSVSPKRKYLNSHSNNILPFKGRVRGEGANKHGIKSI